MAYLHIFLPFFFPYRVFGGFKINIDLKEGFDQGGVLQNI